MEIVVLVWMVVLKVVGGGGGVRVERGSSNCLLARYQIIIHSDYTITVRKPHILFSLFLVQS